jgi:DNA polymerase-1
MWSDGFVAKKFIIIDGSSLVHRAFYALPLLQTAGGHYTNAVYGFTAMLVKLMEQTKPDFIAVAFDKGKITFRNEIYREYKAHRKPTPRELSEQFPLVKEVVKAMGICVIEEAGYEADDIIGTLSLRAEQAGHDVIIVTGDKDALQLISAHTKIMLTKKGISDMEVFDRQAFIEKYGIESGRQIDLKGLMGDSSDNIPGVPGIGEKTALKLLGEYDCIETVLRNIDKIPGKKLQENLRQNSEMAILSKKLATIIRDMPYSYADENFIICPEKEKVQELFSQYEFKSLLGRLDFLFPENSTVAVSPEALFMQAQWLSGEALQQWIQEVRQRGILEFYPVLAGKVPDFSMEAVAVLKSGHPWLISGQNPCWREVLALFADPEIEKITHDAKNIYHACQAAGMPLRGLVFDSLLAAYLLDPTANEYSIVALQGQYLDRPVIGQSEDRFEQAAGTVAVLPEMRQQLAKRLQMMELEELYSSIELPLVEILASMERYGIRVDRGSLECMSAEIGEKIAGLLQRIYQHAGEAFNVNSTKQLGNILFEKLCLPVMKKTKTGYSTDAEVLEKLAGKHEIIDDLLEYRMLTKLKSTYLDGLKSLIRSDTERLHTSFNQTVTATGRLSSSEPNLQNIPVRSEIGKKIRELFIPGAAFDYIMSADYSQIELRILAEMSGDSNLLEAFISHQDIHTRTAAEVFDVPMDEVTVEMRSRAKAVNFGIVYGISDYGLSRDIGVSRKEAGQYIDSYFAKYRGVQAFLDGVVKKAHNEGYVATLFGRRRYLPDINSSNFNRRSFAERTAMNTPIQGTAADIIKKAMLDVYRALTEHGLQSRMLLQVHDELVLEVPEKEVQMVAEIVKHAMEQSVKLSVAMEVEIKIGENWAKAK